MPDKNTNRFIAQPGDFVVIKPGRKQAKQHEIEQAKVPAKPKDTTKKP